VAETRAVLIDGMNLCYRHYHTKKNDRKAVYKGTFVGMFQGFFATLKFIRKRFPAYSLYVLWDSQTNFRYQIYPEYKKKEVKDPEKLKEKEHDRKVVAELIVTLKDMLRVDGVNQVRAEGFEADDVAAYMVNRFKDYEDVILWTGDSDWAQLLAKKNVRLVDTNTKNNAIIDSADFEKINGYPPSGVPVYKSLTGDKSDNIKGIMRFPKKTAKLLASRVQSIEGFFFDRSCLNDISERWRDDIKVEAKKLRMNFQLVWLNTQISNARLIAGNRDKDEFEKFCHKYGMSETQSRSKRDEFYRKRMKREKQKEKAGTEEADVQG
jgi:DNA polymerase-1